MPEITYQEHMSWVKQRAIELARAGNLLGALTSLANDLPNHRETKRNPVPELALQLYIAGQLCTPQEMIKFIQGIN